MLSLSSLKASVSWFSLSAEGVDVACCYQGLLYQHCFFHLAKYPPTYSFIPPTCGLFDTVVMTPLGRCTIGFVSSLMALCFLMFAPESALYAWLTGRE